MSDTPDPRRETQDPTAPAAPSLLRRFRTETKKRLPLHPLERAVLMVVALHLCFLPWALGTMHIWSQATSLALSALGMVLALIPRTYTGDYVLPVAGRQSPVDGSQSPEHGRQLAVDGRQSNSPATVDRPPSTGSPPTGHRSPSTDSPSTGPRPPSHRPGLDFARQESWTGTGLRARNNGTPSTGYRLIAWPRLVRFPLFWIGLALLAYIAVQGYNPSWVWERNDRFWWLRRVTDIPWLPTSIDAPFERFNLWRQFIIYASAWLTLCTLWVGFTRRRSLEILLLVILGNALALAAFGGLQRVTGDFYIHTWLKARISHPSFSSFIYHNHVGAYLALVTTLALAFASRHAFGRPDPTRRSTPAPLFLLLGAALFVAVIQTQSRGATLTFAGFILLTALFVALPGFLRRRGDGTSRWVTLSVAVLFVTVVGLSVQWLDFGAAVRKFERAIKQRENEMSISSRFLAHQAAFEMLKDHGLRGVGAGSFRHYFTEYTRRYPALREVTLGRNKHTLFWEHAHNDWLQIPIEQGAGGTLLLLLGGGYWLFGLVKRRAWRSPLALVVLLGCGQTLVHAYFDFPLQNPAILITWLLLAVSAMRWSEMERA